MSSDPDSNHGELICESVNHNIPSWGMYLAAVVSLALGFLFLAASLPLLWGNRPGDLNGGLAGVAVSVILFIPGGLAVMAARRYPAKLRTFFTSAGVVYRRSKDLSFLTYDEFDAIEFEIIDSTDTRSDARLRMYLGEDCHTDVWLTTVDVNEVLEAVVSTCSPDAISVRHGLHFQRYRRS